MLCAASACSRSAAPPRLPGSGGTSRRTAGTADTGETARVTVAVVIHDEGLLPSLHDPGRYWEPVLATATMRLKR